MAKRKPGGKQHLPKGKIVDGKQACSKCGVRKPTSQMNEVTTPRGETKYICVRCLR